jgi:small subunit ribosomal protein S6
MKQARTYSYEGFFLLPQAAAGDLQAATDHIRTLLTNNGAEVISLFKWDERRLAYEIHGNKRGIYVLAYFTAPGDTMAEIERAFNLSEQVMRSMIIRADHLTPEQMQNAEAERKLADEIRLRREQPTVETIETDMMEVEEEEAVGASADD